MPPEVVVTLGTLAMYAWTTLSISFVASDTPRAIAAALPLLLKDAASDAAPAVAMMDDVSLAVMETLAAVTGVGMSSR